MLGKIEGGSRRERQSMRWLNGITDFDGYEFEQAPRVADGQGSLVCCSPWDCRVGHDSATGYAGEAIALTIGTLQAK